MAKGQESGTRKAAESAGGTAEPAAESWAEIVHWSAS